MEQGNTNSKIAVFGGGRWARVLLSVFIAKSHPNTKFTVHTKHLVDDMKRWIKKSDFRDNISVTDSDPDFIGSKYNAAVVVNSVNGHKKSADMAIAAKVPVLVEKPMTSSFKETLELIESAKKNEVLLFSSWVFLYASYIDNFIDRLGSTENIKSLRFNWTDEFGEARNGEIKSYDSAVPVFKDVLPHVLSILSKIFQNDSYEFVSCSVNRGGCCVELKILVSNVECFLTLERNSDKRRRKILIEAKKKFELDFSTEPGRITIDGNAICGDDSWNSLPSPLEKMVDNFLNEVNSNKFKNSSNTTLALSTSKLIDQVGSAYLKSLDEWVIRHLSEKKINKKDIHYFLSELVLGTFKVSYDKSEKLISHYLDIISSGKVLKEFQKTNSKTTDASITDLIRSLKINL